MDPKSFLNTIYLGDRACKSLLLDGWHDRVAIQIDQISRIRSESGNWEFYTREDIFDGYIVFTDVRSFRMEPTGFIPNDQINYINVEDCDEPSKGEGKIKFYTFTISIISINSEDESANITIRIIARNLHLEDPNRPGIEIYD